MGATAAADPCTLLGPAWRNTPAKTFPHFALLPTELQILILEFAAAGSQSINLQSGIIRNGLLSACHLSRFLVRRHIVTHEGIAWERFKVSFNPTIDYLDITALFRPKILHSSWVMVRQVEATILNGMVLQNPYRALVDGNPRSMARVNQRACSTLTRLTWTEQGRSFMHSLRKLRIDIKAMDASVPVNFDMLTGEQSDWRDLWEWILDSLLEVTEVEMRFIDRDTGYESLGGGKEARNSVQGTVQI